MVWDKESALAELDKLITESSSLGNVPHHSEPHVRWTIKTDTFLVEVFGPTSNFVASLRALTWSIRGRVLIGGPEDPFGAWNPRAAAEREHQRAYRADLEVARGLLLAARDFLESHTMEEAYTGAGTAADSDATIRVINLIERKLRKAIRQVPAKEKEVQDAFETLLVGADIPYSRETDAIEYSSKTYTPDFSLKELGLAVEIKLCARAGREKEIIAEINDDILAYQSVYTNMLFAVYDTGCIRDVDRFTAPFEDRDNVMVRVIKH